MSANMTGKAGLLAALFGALAATAMIAAPAAVAKERLIKISATKNQVVKVAKGKPQTIHTDAAFYEIVLGDPDIANVSPLTDKSFYVLGNNLGTTGIALFDKDKILVGTIDIEVTLDTDQLKSTIQANVPESDINVSSANGRVVISGKTRDAVDAEKVKKIAEKFSGEEDVINGVTIDSSQQVQLNVRFVEVRRSAGIELASKIGASYNFGSGTVSFNSDPGGVGTTAVNTIAASVVSGRFGLDARLKALEDKGYVRRLAEPNLIARSGEEASFLAGGEVPIPIASNDGQLTYTFKKYGVSLDFRPTVLKDGLISLDIAPEVSSIDPNGAIPIGNGLSVPSFIVRRAKTSVDLKSGQSFMMAGLLQSQNEVIRQNIPGVSKMPVVGALASSKDFGRNETELVIIVTPHLIQPIDPTKKIRTPLDASKPGNTADVILGDIDEIKVSDVGKANVAGAAAVPAAGHFLDFGGE